MNATNQLDLFEVEDAPNGGYAARNGDQHGISDSLGEQIVGQEKADHATAPNGTGTQRWQNGRSMDGWPIAPENVKEWNCFQWNSRTLPMRKAQKWQWH